MIGFQSEFRDHFDVSINAVVEFFEVFVGPLNSNRERFGMRNRNPELGRR